MSSSPPSAAPPQSFREALAAQHAGRLEEAARLYRETLAAHPDAAPAWRNLATALGELGRTDEVEAVLRAALARFPADPALRFNLGLQRLAEGDYAEGWPLYEARSALADTASRKPGLKIPEWRGEPIAGRRLLIWPEQGLGDQIMWARFAPQLRAQGAEVAVLCEPALQRLFAQNLDAEVIAAAGQVALPAAEAWTLAGSVPLRLGVTLETLPGAPYLRAPPAAPAGARIGVVTSGNPRQAQNHLRSLPPDQAERLRALPGAISLHLEDLQPLGVADLWDTARIVAGLDLVISVCTSLAHLAGALGKETWVLLSPAADWRWLRGREDSPWYPTARLFRQARREPWRAVVDRVIAALAERA